MDHSAFRQAAGTSKAGLETTGSGWPTDQSAFRIQGAVSERYTLERGRVLLTGVQTLVRVLFDRARADAAQGLRTGTFISGYQGSPLGGFDKELTSSAKLCAEYDIHHVPGLNEEIGATSAWGSQLAGTLPDPRFDGVAALWYGKSPGIDRAADAMRHANYVGTSRTGGAVAAVGDDPASKSSTLPSASESILAALEIPIFFPGSVQEVLDLGLHAFACSRASGLWSALKLVTNVADGVATVEVAPDRVVPAMPSLGYEHQPSGHLLAPVSLEMEKTLAGERRELALAYARANGVNQIEGAREARYGIVAAGRAYHDVRRALEDLGIEGPDGLGARGIRILKPGMVWPLDPEIVRVFARGLSEILVVEEKRPFIEPQVKSALYGFAESPPVFGERDEIGAPLVPSTNVLNSAELARTIGARLIARGVGEGLAERVDRIAAARRETHLLKPVAGPARVPFFCSGCPHNASLKAPDDALIGVGIGCHTMVVLSPEGKGELTGITQMGGEGAQWIGMAPFTERRHFIQNVGDGTFFHSASLAIRAAVAAGSNITFKLLYNGHVAMTGGQPVEGALPVAELTRLLELEGVERIIVTADDTSRYKGFKLAQRAELRDRAELMRSQEQLAKIEGVTVLIHDQQCAAEKRRMRKRGLMPKPADRIWVNERVCEGCGDCGRKSSCLSVVPHETEFGRKVKIDQASCNDDRSCLDGDCPSFATVVPGKRERRLPPPPPAMPDPVIEGPRDFTARIVGIGGTGVVTGNHVVATAAMLDGLHVAGVDQTGLAQKGGPVISDLRLSEEEILSGPATPAAGIDLYLALDAIAATSPAMLGVARPDRTVAVVSTARVPTGLMIGRPEAEYPETPAQLRAIERVTRAADNLYIDAREASERLFGDAVSAQVLAVGAAVQAGLIPVSPAAVEEAIRIISTGPERNLLAFNWGRAAVAAPEALATLTTTPVAPKPDLDEAVAGLVESAGVDGAVRDLLAARVPELIAYQSARYARRYVKRVAAIAAAEAEAGTGTRISEAVARNLYKLMAYKDEYEVARLHLDPAERARVEAEFGEGARVTLRLHPPALRALGLKRKIGFGPRSRWMLRVLRGGRKLRGTFLDPFGKARVRRVERALISEYEETLEVVAAKLAPRTLELCAELCELPGMVRGYEDVKLESVGRYRERRELLLASLQ